MADQLSKPSLDMSTPHASAVCKPWNHETTERNDGIMKLRNISIWDAPTNSRHCVSMQ